MRRDRALGDLLAGDRGHLQQPLRLRLEPVDPRGEHRLHAGRHAGVLDRPRQPVGAALALQVAGLGQRPDDLLDEERVAVGALVDQLAETVQRGVVAGQVAQQLRRVGRAERLQRDPW